jgi:hypothetical protein
MSRITLSPDFMPSKNPMLRGTRDDRNTSGEAHVMSIEIRSNIKQGHDNPSSGEASHDFPNTTPVMDVGVWVLCGRLGYCDKLPACSWQ